MLLIIYPIVKKRYGQQVWNRLPVSAQKIILATKVTLNAFLIVFFITSIVLGLAMPILLVIACIELLIENIYLKNKVEAEK